MEACYLDRLVMEHLLENLNDLDADIIFVKNIDNVVVFKFEEEVAQNIKKC